MTMRHAHVITYAELYALTLFHFDKRTERHTLFQRELAERETEDVLERALLKAHHSKLNGAIAAAEYYRI